MHSLQRSVRLSYQRNSIQPDTNLTGIINEEHQSDPSSDVDDDEDQQQVDCCVCLLRRETTVVFLPCKHARCCEDCNIHCSIHLEKCPICRSTIVQRFQIFT